MNEYKLEKVISVDGNFIELNSLLEGTNHKLKVSNPTLYTIGQIVVFNVKQNKLHRYDASFKNLFNEYRQLQRFNRLICKSTFRDKYLKQVENNANYLDVYKHILEESEDILLVENIRKEFTKFNKFIFEMFVPIYADRIESLFKGLGDEYAIYYAEKNKFYVMLATNTLIEKPYNKFYELFKHIPEINFSKVEIT